MSKIFISYRRVDSGASCGRIYDRLSTHFGKDAIFKDVDSIPIGVNFRSLIAAMIQQCAVQLVVIGPGWLEMTDAEGQRRLENPDDLVRIEVEAGLQRGIPVIPVLVQDAAMPSAMRLPESLRPLISQNGVVVRYDPDFDGDVRRLVRALEQWVTPEQEHAAAGAHIPPSSASTISATQAAGKKTTRQLGLPPQAAHYLIWFTLLGVAIGLNAFNPLKGGDLRIGLIVAGLLGLLISFLAPRAKRISQWSGRVIGALSVVVGLEMLLITTRLYSNLNPIYLAGIFLTRDYWGIAAGSVLVVTGVAGWWYSLGARDLQSSRRVHYVICLCMVAIAWIVTLRTGGRMSFTGGEISAVIGLISAVGLLTTRRGFAVKQRRWIDGIAGIALIVLCMVIGGGIASPRTTLAIIGILAGLASINLALRRADKPS